MNLIFEPLSKENFDRAVNLANVIFPDDSKLETNPELSYRASLNPEMYKERFNKKDLISLQYFLIRNENNDDVGITGWYTKHTDDKNVVWLGWYGVNPDFRGKGYGKEILLKTVEMVKEKGFTVMKLYTSTHPGEAVAQKLYDNLGFVITSEEVDSNSNYKILYREKDLTI